MHCTFRPRATQYRAKVGLASIDLKPSFGILSGIRDPHFKTSFWKWHVYVQIKLHKVSFDYKSQIMLAKNGLPCMDLK